MNSMSMIQLLIITILFWTSNVWAEETSQPRTTQKTSPILTSLAKIKSLREELRQLEQQSVKAQGEELESLYLQRNITNRNLLTELQEINLQLQSFKDREQELRDLLSPYQSEILSAGSSLRSDIRNTQRILKAQRRSLDTLTFDGLRAYKIENTEIDTNILLLNEYINMVTAMQFDASPSQKFIVEILPKRLKALASNVRLSVEKRNQLARTSKFNEPDVETQNKKLLVQEKLDFDTQGLHQMIPIAEQHNINVSEYHSLLVKSTGEISADLFDKEVILVLIEEWWLETKYYIRNNAINFVLKLFILLIILFGFKVLSSTVAHLIRKSVQSNKVHVSILMQNMLISMTSRLIFFLGILFALSQLGFSLGPILAGLGVAGFVVGFALQDVLSNFASGMMILFYRPYDVGDVVDAGGVFGTVQSMNLVSTTVLTFDNQTLIVPNSKIWGDVIKNVTAQKTRRVDMVFGISYSDDVNQAEVILNDIVSNHPKVLDDPQPTIKLHKLNDSSVDFIVRPWSLTADYWDVYWDITREVKTRFDKEGVTIPFPQRDIHLNAMATDKLKDLA